MNTNLPEDKKTLVDQYLEQMSSRDRKAYDIAQQHLQSSFNITKSNGFMEWLKTTKK